MKFFSKTSIIIEVFAVAVLFFILYKFTFVISTDIQSHAEFGLNQIKIERTLPTNLYFLFVYVFSFFSTDYNQHLYSSFFVLILAVCAKYSISKYYLLKHTTQSNLQVTILSTMLLFCFSIPISYFVFNNFYLLNMPPNVWHNSTTIFVMPFAILLFLLSLKQIDDFKFSNLIFIFLLILVNASVKPSFLFPYVIVYPLMLLYYQSFKSKRFYFNLSPIFVVATFVVIKYLLVYKTEVSDSGIAVKFFHFYVAFGQGYSDAFILSLAIFSSALFPLVLLIRNARFLKEKTIQFSLLLLVFSIIIANTLTETGEREAHGNFLWQNFICMYILFFSCMFVMLKKKSENKKFKVEIIIFTLNFISGLIYLTHTFSTNNFF